MGELNNKHREIRSSHIWEHEPIEHVVTWADEIVYYRFGTSRFRFEYSLFSIYTQLNQNKEWEKY